MTVTLSLAAAQAVVTAVLAAGLAAHDHVTVLPGGEPIRLGGELAGGVGVAGAPVDQEQSVARAGIAALAGDAAS